VTVADALLLALGAVAVGSGALVVTSSHIVRAGLYLVVSLGAMAGLYLVLGAELVAWVQVLVYVGAVVVLLLFAVMLTRAPIGPSTDLDRPAWPALVVGAGVGLGLAVLLVDAFRWSIYALPAPGTTERMGAELFGNWVLPFEVLSVLLLSALVGAIVLSRPDIGAHDETQHDETQRGKVERGEAQRGEAQRDEAQGDEAQGDEARSQAARPEVPGSARPATPGEA
jgi:NADH-quinone oxidoreductase subunit J